MAKKKSKKKDGNKKDIEKKKIKKQDLIKKKLKKKASKKKKAVKKKAQKNKIEDHSSNYNVSDATKKLRSLKSIDELLEFTKGEQRLTIAKVIPAAKNRLKKV